MSKDDSSHSSSLLLPTSSSRSNSCQVGGQTSHGNHFGALVCRACAAYFRRAIIGNFANKACRCKSYVSIPKEKKIIKCKRCRFEQCIAIGMTVENIQYDHDLKSSLEASIKNLTNNRNRESTCINIPSSIESILGRPHFICFLDLDSPPPITNIIDVSSVLEKASEILKENPGARADLNGSSFLEKMTFALNAVRKPKFDEIKRIKNFSKNDSLWTMENEFLNVAKWLTYCDEYQKLPHDAKMQILESAWQLWSKLEKTAMTAEMRLNKKCDPDLVMVTNEIAFNFDEADIDVSWFSGYDRNQIVYFFDALEQEFLEEVLQPLVKLQPTSIELAFMLTQICFQQAGKLFQGIVLESSERVNTSISNELHKYYVEEMKMPRYCARLSQLLKINQLVMKQMHKRRERQRLARILNIFTADITHPEFFYGF